ncbi:DUF3575 domain-containing protein [Gaetbulibacter aestuarii]|uniref:DUF3575 domain-containing protein n=1 Tax=Gaetbulibacter aestuarii TaxID=1502358 RepID=A0ABW7MZ95_9FLAO
MKTKTFFLLCTLLLSSFAIQKANAQESDITQAIKFKPSSLIFGTVQMGYEIKVSKNSSFQVDGVYIMRNINEVEYTGFGGAVQYRFYLQDTALKGWFVGPYGLYASSTGTNDLKFTRTTVGLAIGYQFQLNPVIIDIFTGPAYYSFKADDPDYDAVLSGFGPLIGFSLGIGF